MQRKAACNDYPLVLLFPEATTTNGRALIHFKLGAFTPRLPIQPVVIRYPFVHFDNSWGDISVLNSALPDADTIPQFHGGMHHDLVEYLPVVYPSLSEQSTQHDSVSGWVVSVFI
ncbi:unnamed protein product [Sphagnum balticum]